MDRTALVEALCRLSAFAAAHADQIASVEVNPLLVRRSDAVALDALVVLDGG